MVLTRLLCVRFCPSSLCPDLSSFLLPLGQKHNIWVLEQIGKDEQKQELEKHDWFTDKRKRDKE